MKTKLSLVVGIAVAALAVSVPTAFGEGRLAGGLDNVDAVAYFHANELATAAQSGSTDLASYRDAGQRPGSQALGSVRAETSHSNQNTIEWGQIGIAFGVGLLLALGLVAAVRFRPTRAIAN
jgi:hypothetical protein